MIKKSKKSFYFSLAITAVIFLAYILGWSSLLTVKKVEISGTDSVSVIKSELQRKSLDVTDGMRMARVDLRGIKSTLSEMDWLDLYSVERNWLAGRIQIVVVEKFGIAKALTENGSILFFDTNGELFKPVSKAQISSFNKLALVTSESESREDLAQVAKLLQELPNNLDFLLIDLKGISVGKSGYLNMITRIGNRDVQIKWGKADFLVRKSQVLSALLELPENKAATKFDLSIPEAPIAS